MPAKDNKGIVRVKDWHSFEYTNGEVYHPVGTTAYAWTHMPLGIQEETLANMEAIAFKRGFLMPGKRIDYERTGRTVIDEFRSGKLGRITLETVPSEGEPEND